MQLPGYRFLRQRHPLSVREICSLRAEKWRDFSEGAVVEWVAPSAQRGRCSSLWIYIDECRPSVLASMIELERS